MIFRKSFLTAFSLLIGLMALGLPLNALDIDKKNLKRIKELKSRSSGLISSRINNAILRSQDMASMNQYKQAVNYLEGQLAKSFNSKEDKVQILKTLGLIYAQKEDYEKAKSSLNQALQFELLKLQRAFVCRFMCFQGLRFQMKITEKARS